MRFALALLLLIFALGAQLPRPVVEEPVLQPEATPVLEDVSALVLAKEFRDFTVYEFTGKLRVQILDLDVADGILWAATAQGIVRHDTASRKWGLVTRGTDMPADRAENIAARKDAVAADLSRPTRPGYTVGAGVHVFYPADKAWSRVDSPGAWDLAWEGEALWIATSHGAQRHWLRDQMPPEAPPVQNFARKNSGLQHDSVHEIQVHNSTVWFATTGDYVSRKEDFEGGGVSVVDRATGKWKSYTHKNGLARDYCSSMAVDDHEVWVAHWHEESGLSILNRHTQKWRVLKKSRNGMPAGGVVVALEQRAIWVGQQRGLLRIDRKSEESVLYTELNGVPGYIVSAVVVSGNTLWASAYSHSSNGARIAGLVRIQL